MNELLQAFVVLAMCGAVYALAVLFVVAWLFIASHLGQRHGKPQPDYYSLDCLSGIHKACPHCSCTHHLAVLSDSERCQVDDAGLRELDVRAA